jgi:hypothetical protein
MHATRTRQSTPSETITGASQASQESDMPTQDQIQLWYHYEEIAMHFNTLIMQYRLQVMGGFGAIGAVSSYLIGGKVEDEGRRAWLRLTISAGLWCLLAAAAALDVFYYKRLLRGAVDELLEFERVHAGIRMSTRIDAVVGPGRDTIHWVYGSLLSVLGLWVIGSLVEWFRVRFRLARAAVDDGSKPATDAL